MPKMKVLVVAGVVGAIVFGVIVIAVVVQVVQQFWWLIVVSAGVFAAVKYFARRRARNAFYGTLPDVPGQS